MFDKLSSKVLIVIMMVAMFNLMVGCDTIETPVEAS